MEPGGRTLYDIDGDSAVCGEDFRRNKEADSERALQGASISVPRMPHPFKKVIDTRPQPKTTTGGHIDKSLGEHAARGAEAVLRAAQGDMDPQITALMKTMEITQQEREDSVIKRGKTILW